MNYQDQNYSRYCEAFQNRIGLHPEDLPDLICIDDLIADDHVMDAAELRDALDYAFEIHAEDCEAFAAAVGYVDSF